MPIKSALSISCLIRHCLLYRPGFILAECCANQLELPLCGL